MKATLYAIVVVCFMIAGAIDLAEGNRKLGVVALLFAVVNAVVFFWRD